MQAPQWQMARLMDGYLVTQMLHVAAALGVADALAERPQTSAELARVVGAEPGALHRVLRGLATEDVVTEDDDGRFALTPAGELLRDGVPGSLRGAVLARGELYHDAAGRMLAGVRGEGVPYELANGAPFFDDLAEHPEREAAFQASMAGRSDQEVGDVVDAYDFGGIDRLVDVGGGAGNLLAAILRSAPGLTGVLFDRPGVAPAAEARMRGAGVADRCELVAGDFFASVPAGADAYVLSRVLHDWDDEDAGRILDRVRAAMGDGSRLLVVEAILPERAADLAPAIRMDVNMLMLFSQARERTESEFGELLARAGLRLRAVFPTRSPAGLSVLEAVPTPGRAGCARPTRSGTAPCSRSWPGPASGPPSASRCVTRNGRSARRSTECTVRQRPPRRRCQATRTLPDRPAEPDLTTRPETVATPPAPTSTAPSVTRVRSVDGQAAHAGDADRAAARGALRVERDDGQRVTAQRQALGPLPLQADRPPGGDGRAGEVADRPAVDAEGDAADARGIGGDRAQRQRADVADVARRARHGDVRAVEVAARPVSVSPCVA